VACSKRRSGYRPGSLAVRLSDLRAAFTSYAANLRLQRTHSEPTGAQEISALCTTRAVSALLGLCV